MFQQVLISVKIHLIISACNKIIDVSCIMFAAIAEKVRDWKERQEKIARGEISGETEEPSEEMPSVSTQVYMV